MAKPPTATDDRWMLRGVGKDIRKAVKERAAADGVSIGKWVKKALRSALDQSNDGHSPPDFEDRLAQMEARLQRLEATLDSTDRARHGHRQPAHDEGAVDAAASTKAVA